MPRIALYSSTSWLRAIAPDGWHLSGLIDWDAEYGPDDGREHPATYPGPVGIHQYTSVGHIAGVTGPVDLDDITADITEQVIDLQPDERAALFALCAQMGINPDGSPHGWQLPPKKPSDPLTLYDAVNLVMHLLTDQQPSRVAGSTVRLSPTDAAMNADAYGYRVLAQLAALSAAVAAQHGITTDELTTIINQAIAAHIQITGTVTVSGQ